MVMMMTYIDRACNECNDDGIIMDFLIDCLIVKQINRLWKATIQMKIVIFAIREVGFAIYIYDKNVWQGSQEKGVSGFEN